MEIVKFFIDKGYTIDISRKKLNILLQQLVEKGYEWKIEGLPDGTFKVKLREYVSEIRTEIVDKGDKIMSYDEILTLIKKECVNRIYIVDEQERKLTFICDSVVTRSCGN